METEGFLFPPGMRSCFPEAANVLSRREWQREGAASVYPEEAEIQTPAPVTAGVVGMAAFGMGERLELG